MILAFAFLFPGSPSDSESLNTRFLLVIGEPDLERDPLFDLERDRDREREPDPTRRRFFVIGLPEPLRERDLLRDTDRLRDLE